MIVEERAPTLLLPAPKGFEAQGPRDDPEFRAACLRTTMWNEQRKTARLAEIVEEARQAQAEADAEKALVERRERIQERHAALSRPFQAYGLAGAMEQAARCPTPTCMASRDSVLTDAWAAMPMHGPMAGQSWAGLSRGERHMINSAMGRIYG